MPLPTPYPYLLSFDFNTPNADYSRLIQELQKSAVWWHYMKTTWIVFRHETLVELQSLLLPMIHPDDRLLIVPAKGPAAGWLPMDAWQWINQNVPREW